MSPRRMSEGRMFWDSRVCRISLKGTAWAVVVSISDALGLFLRAQVHQSIRMARLAMPLCETSGAELLC